MPLPPFENAGDLPEGLHRASLQEVLARFGAGTAQRRDVAARLLRVYESARATNGLARFIIFGSFVTSKPDPNADRLSLLRCGFNSRYRSGRCPGVFQEGEGGAVPPRPRPVQPFAHAGDG